MKFWSADGSEHREAIDEKSFEGDEESFEDWTRRVRDEALGEGSERLDHEALETVEPSYRDRPLSEFRERFPGEYTEPWETSVPAERFRPPEGFAGEVNPRYDQSPEHQINCCDCARAVERIWRGQRETAAGLRVDGELGGRMEMWAGEGYRSVDAAEIRRRLEAGGHGSSGIVSGVFRSADGTMGGHSFNVVNDRGEVKAVDGQVGMVEPWSDRTGHPYLPHVWDEAGDQGRLMVMGWDAQGRPLW